MAETETNGTAGRNLEKVAKVVTKQMLEDAIRKTDGVDDVAVQDFTVDWATKVGDNAGSYVLRILCNVRNHDKVQALHFILKTSQDNEELNQIFLKAGLFKKEILTYEELFPAFARMQRDAGVEPILPAAPKYYHGVEDAVGVRGVVMVDDMKALGFSMIDKKKGADLKHAKLVVRELATWHALALALKNRDEVSMKDKFPFAVKDNMYGSAFGPLMEADLAVGVKNLGKVLEQSSLIQDLKDRAKGFLQLDPLQVIRQALQPVEPFAVICHGDAWCNNMLFKYDEVDGKEVPVAIRLIDFQCVRYALPLSDLAYFMALNFPGHLRKAHLRDLLKLYHARFTEVLAHVKFDCPEFTLEVVEDLWRRVAPFGFLQASSGIPWMMAEDDVYEDVENVLRSETTSVEAISSNYAEVVGAVELTDKMVEEFLSLLEEGDDWGVF